MKEKMKGGINKMAYEEINPQQWTYTKDGDFIEGILVNKQEDVGVNKSMLYSIETSQGVKSVWGATVLDERMALVQIESKIRLTYKGTAPSKKGKNPAKLFRVEVDKSVLD
jgi:hypothetical protein